MEGLEACDDANTQDGDGCSAACEHEHVTPACVKIVEAPELGVGGMLATADGRILIGGEITTTGTGSHGWLGAFDSGGSELWTLDLEGDFAGPFIESEDGFIVYANTPFGVDDELLTIDAAGALTESVPLTGADGFAIDMIDTEAGLLLAGGGGEDLWLGRVSVDGALETLMAEDHAGLWDVFRALERHEDSLGALATVGTVDNTDGDFVPLDTEATLLIEYDEQGSELRRTLLSGGDELTLQGYDLAVTKDGTWIVAGLRYPPHSVLSVQAWAVAVREGEVLWTQETPDSTAIEAGARSGRYSGVAASDEVLLLGMVRLGSDGVARLGTRVDAADGSVLWREIGEVIPDVSDRYTAATTTPDGRAWLLRTTDYADRVEQWLCGTQL
ncbi:hypothetical protein ENSA5_41610 [Enhygromyxa salina]|uniref:Uncharacterized protein n=1 Tax=Enhygromyxa salina TaxID=215803 RepID=A0A2S9XME3_9BACT|nr:hypothetical protein ENSA5_41610 [Enhygromyxa salina]